MEKFYNNIRATAESEKCSNDDATFKNQKYICIKSNNYRKIVNGFNNNILVSELCKRCGYIKRFKGGI